MNFIKRVRSYNFSILIVDDSSVSRYFLKDLLNIYTKNIYLASNGKDALNMIKKFNYDIIITDIEMPLLNGIELTKEIRKINYYVPIIAISSVATSNRLIELINSGISAFIVKPFDIKNIKSQLFRIIKPILEKNEIIKKRDDIENRFKSIFTLSRDGIAILDLDTKFLIFNKSYEKMLGFSTEELKDKTCIGLTIKEDIPKAKKIFEKVLKEGYVEKFQKKCLTKSGEIIDVEINIILMPDKKHFITTVKDITDSNELKNRVQSYVSLIDKSVITSTTNLEGVITSVSEAFCKISKYSKDELIGQPYNIMKYSDTPSSLYKELWKTITNNNTWSGEIKNLAKDGSIYWVKTEISPIFNRNNIKIGYTAIKQDITQRKIIEQLSIRDGLTNIYNRRYFNDFSGKFINSLKRDNRLISFSIFDIDHFKQYNDNYGHLNGDKVLIKIASTISALLKRSDDIFFRLGGEEFGILFKPKNREKVIEFCEEIRKSIEDLNIEHKYNSASNYVTASFGLTIFEAKEIDSIDILYKETDKLLYKAKELGKNIVIHN